MSNVNTSASEIDPNTPVGLRRRFADHPNQLLLAIFVVLVIATCVKEPNYLSWSGLRNTLLLAAPLAIMAGGQTLCLLTGGVDLSVAMTATAAAYVCAHETKLGAIPAIGFGLLVAMAIGAINGVGVAVGGVNPLIMTLGMQGILVGFLTKGAQSFLTGSTNVAPFVKTVGGGALGPIPYNVIVWGIVSVVIIWGLASTGIGRTIYAVGDNPIACRLAGIKVWQVKIVVYLCCALMAGVAGILLAGRSGSVDLQLANFLLLPSVAAAVIGGTSIFGGVGGYTGTILGALILGVLERLLLFFDASEAIKQMIYGALILSLAWLYAHVTRE
jgi:ribose transport system permease protein